jgi:hypothetical protein
VPFPDLNDKGDLPAGVHHASLDETMGRFGVSSTERKVLALRLQRVYRLAKETGQLRRFVVFGSFITSKDRPNDVDVFMIMEDTFDCSAVTGEGRLVFHHNLAQSHFGCSVFWVRRLAAFGGEEETIGHWQIRRDGTQRGIVEITEE